jgi:hypothetical protein
MSKGRITLVALLAGCSLVGVAAIAIAWNSFAAKGSIAKSAATTAPAAEVKEVAATVKTSSRPEEAEVTTDLLDEAERNYLWDIEHHANILHDVAFKRASKALAKGDGKALQEMLIEGFSAELPGNSKPVKLDTDLVHFQRSRIDDGPSVAADANQFVASLLALRALYHQEPKAKLSIMQLAPVEGRQGREGLWKGTCLLRMWGEADPGQPTEVVQQWEITVPRPSDKLASSGRWLQSCKILQTQVSHSNHFLLRPAGEERGVDVKRWWDNWPIQEEGKRITDTGSVSLCDFNRDGCVDMLVTDVSGQVFYQGNPDGKFTDRTDALGLKLPWRGVLVLFADLDGDGWEDLLLGNKIFRNDEGQRFTFVKLCSDIGMVPTASNVSTVDYNLDGKMDLYFAVGGVPKGDSWVEGKSGRTHGNQLLMNLGDWKFQDVSKTANAEGGRRSVFTTAWFDANGDGRPDVHVPNEYGNGVLLVNQPDGTFQEVDLIKGPSDFGTMGLTVGDFNNDGNIDIYCANMYSKAGNRVIGNLRPDAYPQHIMELMNNYTKGSQLWKNNGNLSFEKVGLALQVADVGWAYGPCMADLDNDGFLDIHATAGFMSVDPDEPDG